MTELSSREPFSEEAISQPLPAAYYLYYFDNNMHKRFTAASVEELHQALNEQFDLVLCKKGVKVNDPTWNYNFFTNENDKIFANVSVSFTNFHRDPKGPERKWMKITKTASISKTAFSVSTEVVEEEFPKQIPYFFDNNQKDIKYANSLEAILEAYQTHLMLSMHDFSKEEEAHNNVFYEMDNEDRDRVMSEWAFTYFAPYERKWVRLTRKVSYRVRSPPVSIKM